MWPHLMDLISLPVLVTGFSVVEDGLTLKWQLRQKHKYDGSLCPTLMYFNK